MSVTGVNAKPGIPFFASDQIVPVSASGFSTANAGDWMLYSAQWAIACTPATIGSPAYKVSAAGIALEYNPTFDPLGRAITNSSLTVLRAGYLRVTASASATARTIPMGAHAYPSTTGSGIVGQTATTGVGVLWVTAPPQGISANPTGALASGVAVVVNHPIGGDAGIGQIDIVFNLATNVGYF